MSEGRFNVAVSGDLLLADHKQLAAIGRRTEGGVTRLAYTPEQEEARAWLMQKLYDLGLTATVDHLGNVEGRPQKPRHASTEDVLSGSHIDTVSNGGSYDGALGVACAIHAVRALESCRSGSNAGIVGFAAEESTRFGTGCIGSRGLVGE